MQNKVFWIFLYDFTLYYFANSLTIKWIYSNHQLGAKMSYLLFLIKWHIFPFEICHFTAKTESITLHNTHPWHFQYWLISKVFYTCDSIKGKHSLKSYRLTCNDPTDLFLGTGWSQCPLFKHGQISSRNPAVWVKYWSKMKREIVSNVSILQFP